MALASHTALLIVCTVVCSVLILTRCGYRFFFSCKKHSTCHRRWRVDDTYMALAILPLVARVVMMSRSFALNPTHYRDPATFDEALASGKTIEQLNHDRELALKLLIPVRIAYALFLWALKLCLLTFYARFLGHLEWGARAINVLWWAIIVSYVGVIVATLAECRPLHLAWEITPKDHRHHCSRAVANLLVMAICNAVTDIALLILPYPILYRSRFDRKTKLQLSGLFGIGLVVVAITILRIPLIFMSSVTQSARSLWASIEIICACIVANAAFFYALVKDLQGHHYSHSNPRNNNMGNSDFYLQSIRSAHQSPSSRKASNAGEQGTSRHVEVARGPHENGSDEVLV